MEISKITRVTANYSKKEIEDLIRKDLKNQGYEVENTIFIVEPRTDVFQPVTTYCPQELACAIVHLKS